MEKEEMMANMDKAALEAEQGLNELDRESAKLIAKWWGANYAKAGHKRLGRILVAFNKKHNS